MQVVVAQFQGHLKATRAKHNDVVGRALSRRVGGDERLLLLVVHRVWAAHLEQRKHIRVDAGDDIVWDPSQAVRVEEMQGAFLEAARRRRVGAFPT